MVMDFPQPTVDDRLLGQIVSRIVERFHPHKIILFGSYAHGKPSPESDVDLLVIMDSVERPARRSAAVALACRPRHLAMDILVRTPQEIEERLASGDFFIRDILERGRVLYDRSRMD